MEPSLWNGSDGRLPLTVFLPHSYLHLPMNRVLKRNLFSSLRTIILLVVYVSVLLRKASEGPRRFWAMWSIPFLLFPLDSLALNLAIRFALPGPCRSAL